MLARTASGGEESKRHQLHCRFIIPDNRRRFGKIRAITWNIKVLNRLRYSPDTWDGDAILRYGVMRITAQV